MKYVVDVNGRTFEVVVEGGPERSRVLLDGREVSVDFRRLSGAAWSLLHDHGSHLLRVEAEADGYRVEVEDASYRVTVKDERELLAEEVAGGGPGGGDREVRCLMPGVVTRIVVEEGGAVTEGQALLYVEAMKMENEVRAPGAGTVAALRVRAGDSVAGGQVLVEIDPDVA